MFDTTPVSIFTLIFPIKVHTCWSRSFFRWVRAAAKRRARVVVRSSLIWVLTSLSSLNFFSSLRSFSTLSLSAFRVNLIIMGWGSSAGALRGLGSLWLLLISWGAMGGSTFRISLASWTTAAVASSSVLLMPVTGDSCGDHTAPGHRFGTAAPGYPVSSGQLYCPGRPFATWENAPHHEDCWWSGPDHWWQFSWSGPAFGTPPGHLGPQGSWAWT